MNIIGIDIAKSSFHFCVMNKVGKVVKRKKVSRAKLVESVLQVGPGIIGLESCGGSNYWARTFKDLGYEVRILSAKFVKPYVKSHKNDEVDAEAICEAASRPQMRFVSIKSEEQQDIQNLHRIRGRLIKQRTALSNEIRGLLLEYGIAFPKGVSQLRSKLPELIETHSDKHSSLWRVTFAELYEEFVELDKKVESVEKKLEAFAKANPICSRLLKVSGVGLITATAILAAVADAKEFKNGRQFAAWLGLIPLQNSTGGNSRLGKITKIGNKYLRTLLVQGARSLAMAAQRKAKANLQPDITADWLFKLAARSNSNKAAIALANKMARRIWRVLNGDEFKLPEQILAAA